MLARFNRIGLIGVGLMVSAVNAQRFTAEDISAWETRSFLGETQYSVRSDPALGDVIEANSQATASGLFLEEKIDLEATPWLSWRWQVAQFPTVVNESAKAGDDFAARIYVVFNTGFSFLSTKAVSYVWSQQAQPDAAWENPFVGASAMMLAVETDTTTGVWRVQQRNVRDDIQRLYGKDVRYIKAIAIMTDADNSESAARAFYHNLRFSEQALSKFEP